MTEHHPDVGRTTLIVLCITGFLVVTFWILQPFLAAILWAATLVVTTWPLMLYLQRHTGGRRGIAVVLMTSLLLLLLIVPLSLAVAIVLANLDELGRMVRVVLSLKLPSPPVWLSHMPFLGARAADAWEALRAAGRDTVGPMLTPYARVITQWVATAVGSLGTIFVQFLLTTVIAAIMYSKGEQGAAMVVRFGRRLAGERGERAVYLAGKAIRSVALGVVVTALAQSIIGGLGLALAGVPFPVILMALMFVLCLVQLGPALVLIPATIWMYYDGAAVSATILLAFSLVAMTVDQFLRPILIRQGTDIPLLLIFAGVIGGLLAFGILGLFIGPTVLAVAYTTLSAWISEGQEASQLSANPNSLEGNQIGNDGNTVT